jgi:hypothetical protein
MEQWVFNATPWRLYPPGRETRYPLYRVPGLVWTSVKNFAPHRKFAPRAVQPLLSRYTDYAISARTWNTLDVIMWSLFSAIAGDQRVWISGRLMNSRGDNRKRILLLSHLVHHKFPMKSPRIEPQSPLWKPQSPRWKISTNPLNSCATDH